MAASGTGLLAIAGCMPTSVHEKDLLSAGCALVERMNVVTFIKSDEDFEIGVRCGNGSAQTYHEIFSLAQSYEYAVLAKAAQQGEPRAIELVHCDAGAHGALQGNIDRLNAISAQTGFVFSLRPPVAGCERTLAGLAGSLTDPNSKPFDRRIK